MLCVQNALDVGIDLMKLMGIQTQEEKLLFHYSCDKSSGNRLIFKKKSHRDKLKKKKKRGFKVPSVPVTCLCSHEPARASGPTVF